MKCNPWTLGLLSAGLVSLPAIMQAEEKPSSVLTALSATTLSGYVDTSAQWNPGTGNAFVPGYAFNSPTKSDGFNLNVVELNLEKPVDAADAWGAGYKFSMLAGPDASTFNTRSAVAPGNPQGSSADFAVKQAYVALHAPVGNGLDFKIGVWDTIIGYEVFESINNPNVTRSYGYTMEPTTHTGIQATYQVCETVSVTAGIADSFGATINGRAFFGPVNTTTGVQGPQAESYKTYMGAMTFTAPTNSGFLSGSTVTACVINGYNALPGANGGDQTSFYAGATVNTPVTGLKAGACYDYAALNLQPVPGSSTENSAYAHALGLYASYQVNEKLSVYGRGEYAASSGAVPGTPAAAYPGASIVGWGPKNVYELTGTVQYDLWKNVLSRFEVRWDHAEHGNAYAGTSIVQGPMGNNYFTLLADIAYKF